MRARKLAKVTAYQFDCLPNEACVAEATAWKAGVAVRRATEAVFNYPPLKGKRIRTFQMRVVITDKVEVKRES